MCIRDRAPALQSKPAVPEKAPEAPAPKEPEQAGPVKHRLTPEEKKIKEAVMDTLKAQIAGRNDGMPVSYTHLWKTLTSLICRSTS